MINELNERHVFEILFLIACTMGIALLIWQCCATTDLTGAAYTMAAGLAGK